MGVIKMNLFLILIICTVIIKAQDIFFPDEYELNSRLTERPFGIDEFQKSNELFAADLYRELNKVKTDNFLVCPYSLQIILALVHAGARATTSLEIAKALHFPDNTDRIQNMIKKLSLDSPKSYTLTSANKVYLAHRFRINDNFKKITQDIFKADIESLDLSRSEESALKINQWVEQKTNNTIKDLIDKKYLDTDTVSVMINALYFNADWLVPFDSRMTKSLGFFVNKTTSVDVKMMVTGQYANWYFNKYLDATFLELPYQGDEVSMTIALPNKIDGLSVLEDNIETVLEKQPLAKSQTDVTIWLPKFKVETTILLEQIMKNLGIENAFTRNADFSGMTVGGHKIFISHAVQKTFIEVTEKGTTAGAATAISNSDRSIGDRFIANHPFIYIIRHKKNGILFVGKFSNPTGTEIN